jgi:hypothetical protein
MRDSVLMSWTQAFRQFGVGALLVTVLVVLASCASSPGLQDDTVEPRGKTVPPVVFHQIIGLPPGKLADLKTALAVAGGQRDIGFVDGDLQSGGFSISGRFQALADSAGVRVFYDWELRDGGGVLIHTVNGEENAGLFTGTDPWAAVTTSVLDRIARSTTQSIAARLSAMGYATRLARLFVPPDDYFAMAGPDANRDIDFETLNGPGMAMAGLDMIAAADPTLAMAAIDADSGDLDVAQSQPDVAEPPSKEVAAVAPPKPSGPVRTEDGKTEIRAVVVMPVKGSPGGGGDAELTAAMRRTLTAAGWPVVSQPRPDALMIVGQVKVANSGPEQAVSVRWEVKSPDGKKLGDVNQANRVPTGALDSGWGQAAFAVSEAAAMGIFDIVKRVQ